LQVTTAANTIDSFLRGSIKAEGSSVSYLGNLSMPFKQIKTAPMVFDEATQTMIINKALSSGRGDQALAAMIEAGGTRIAHNPAVMAGDTRWLADIENAVRDGKLTAEDAAKLTPESSRLLDNLSNVGRDELSTIGQHMAGDAAKTLGATRSTGPGGQILGKLKPGVGEYFTRLNKGVTKLESDAAHQLAQPNEG